MLFSTMTQKKIQFSLALCCMFLVAFSTYLTLLDATLFNTLYMTISSGLFLAIVLYKRN